jgi:hypothetical protein
MRRRLAFLVPFIGVCLLSAASLQGAVTPVHTASVPLYNRWICYAQAPNLGWRVFYGYSHLFPPGSGQGQQAHYNAFQSAMQRCNLANGGYGCVSNFQQYCSVEQTN